MGVGDCRVYRTYRCDHCGIEIGKSQLVKNKWLKKCPNCGKHELFMTCADMKMSILFDTLAPKTLGGLMEKNAATLQKSQDISGTMRAGQKKKRHKFDILKNPAKYIETGTI